MKRITFILLIFFFTTLYASPDIRTSSDEVAFQPLLGTWDFQLRGGTYSYSSVSFKIDKIVYMDDYHLYVATGIDNFGDDVECFIDGGDFSSIGREFYCWTFSADDTKSGNFAFDVINSTQAVGGYAVGSADNAIKDLYNLNCDYLVGHKLSASLNMDTLKAELLKKHSYDISGIFGQHDFEDASTTFDWAFTLTSNHKSYQLQGKASGANDVFGWKEVDITTPVPIWYMFALGADIDGDSTQKFDWILASVNGSALYKLAGVSASGNFEYSEKIPLEYTLSSDKKQIYFGSTKTSLFGDKDIDTLLSKNTTLTVTTLSNDAKIDLKITDTPKVTLKSGDITSSTDDRIVLTDDAAISNEHIGEPLFINDEFQGMIQSVNSNGTSVKLKNAAVVSDAYKSFDILFNSDEILHSLQRTIQTKKLAKYDYLNSKPLQLSVKKKMVTNQRGLTHEDIVLRIDIPEGYYVPTNSRAFTCSFWNADCSMTLQGTASQKVTLNQELKAAGITFSSKGSYIEIGIGSYLKAHYDYNRFSDDIFSFELAQSAYFDAVLSATLSAEVNKNWSTRLDLIYDFDVEVTHPYSHLVKTTVFIDPGIIFGVEGKVSGNLQVTSQTKRSGEIRFKYASDTNLADSSNSVKDTPKLMSKDSVSIAIEAEGHAYIYPALNILPTIRFLRVDLPVTLVWLQSGIKLDNEIKGKIGNDFIVENLNDMKVEDTTQASLTTSLFGLIQGRWMVRVGHTYLYNTPDYKDLYKTPAMKIFEWNVAVLNMPTLIMEELNDETYALKFDLDFNTTLKPKIKFYYTTDGTDITTKNYSSVAKVWKTTDKAITIKGSSIIKVRAVLKNKDISKTAYAFGTSISPQAFYMYISPPVASVADNTTFINTLSVSLTQKDGYKIAYKLNSGNGIAYTSAITLSDTATIMAYAYKKVGDDLIKSETVTFNYTKLDCTENEEIVYDSSGHPSCQETQNPSDTSEDETPEDENPIDNDSGPENWDGYHYEDEDIDSDETPSDTSTPSGNCPKTYNKTVVEALWNNDTQTGTLCSYHYIDGWLEQQTTYLNGEKVGKEYRFFPNGSINIEWSIPFGRDLVYGYTGDKYMVIGCVDRYADGTSSDCSQEYQ